MSLPPADRQDVPLIDPTQLVRWMYEGSETIQIVREGHQLISLPPAQQFNELLAMAFDNAYEWVLIDGPRTRRPSWVIDPWWSDQPELSPKIIQATRAHCLTIQDLQQALTIRIKEN